MDKGQKHMDSQLKWLRADFQELERLLAEELAGGGSPSDCSSDGMLRFATAPGFPEQPFCEFVVILLAKQIEIRVAPATYRECVFE